MRTYPNVTGIDVFREWIIVEPRQSDSGFRKWYYVGISVFHLRARRQFIHLRCNLRYPRVLLADTIVILAKRREPREVQRMRWNSAL